MTLKDPFSKNEQRFIWGVLITGLIGFYYQLGIYPLFLEEPRRALIALEMVLQENLLVPTQTGDLYYRKPPFYNWLIIIADQLFGAHIEFGVRSISVTSHIALSYLSYVFFRKWSNREVALLSSLAFLFSVDIFYYFSALGEIDLFYALATSLSIFLIFHFGGKSEYWKLFVYVYLLTAVCFLTKGLSALPYTAISLLAYFITNRKFRMLFSIQHITGVLLFAGILSLYFYGYSTTHDVNGWWSTLFSESADKAASGGFDQWIAHFVSFPFDTLKNIAPAALLIPALFVSKQRSSVDKAMLWVVILNFVVYWVSVEGRSRYIYPLFPFMCFILVNSVQSVDKAWFEKYLRILAIILLSIVTLALPSILFIDSLANIPNRTLTVIIGEALVFVVWLHVFKYQIRPFILILAVLVIGKWGISSIVPQTRKLNSNAAKDKQLALDIAEITAGNNIYRWGDVRFSLTTVFYLERAKQKVLYQNDEIDNSAYYFVYEEDLLDFPSSLMILPLEYHGAKIYLVRPMPSS